MALCCAAILCSPRSNAACARAHPSNNHPAVNNPSIASSAAAGPACSSVAPVASAANKPVIPSPAAENTGQLRKRNNCLPAPCSSTPILVRIPPSSPPRISRSHRSKSPPRVTMAPWPESACSNRPSQSPEGYHCSLHNWMARGCGETQAPSPRRLHGVNPWLIRPKSRANGWTRCSPTVSSR